VVEESARHRAYAHEPSAAALAFAAFASSTGSRVRTDSVTRAAVAPDASHILLTPEVVVAPSDSGAVARLLPALAEHGLHLTFRSGGTSLSGQAVTDSVLLDVRRGFRGIELLDDGARVRVQGGATLRSVNQRLAPFGRRLGPDPSSEVACTIGGIVANNSSGMACGTEENSYSTLESVEVILASGTRIDTSAVDADERLRTLEPDLYQGLLNLRDRVRGNPESVRRLREQFAIKNTMGYGLNSFLDHDRASQILARLLVGSEGTLGFLASVTFTTVPMRAHRATSLAVFESLAAAAAAVPSLIEADVALVELMDSVSLDVARATNPRIAEFLGTNVGGAALLVERQTDDASAVITHAAGLRDLLIGLSGVSRVSPATDRTSRDELWHMRKGLYAAVAASRPPGTTALLEDVAVPVEHLPKACQELTSLFDRHGYERSVIFGHAKDGNVHFMITDRFSGDRLETYRRFTDDLVDLVLGQGGSLKAEHGTGRVMAPFVRRQYGDELYDVMVQVKSLFDPQCVLNPGVVVGAPADAHLLHVKTTSPADSEIDSCVECGYCEPVCPSKDLTLTPRQRIALRRSEQAAAADGFDLPASPARDFELVETCATDGMCQTACPVLIDTGALVRRLRSDAVPPAAQQVAKVAARHWGGITRAVSSGLTLASHIPPVAEAVTKALRAIAPAEVSPVWSRFLPAGGRSRAHLRGSSATSDVVLLPSCMGTIFGGAHGVSAAFLSVCERAGINTRVPDDVAGLCCGTPWSSKGLVDGGELMEERLRIAVTRWAGPADLTVIVDASTCTSAVQRVVAPVSESRTLRVVDVVQFTADELLPRLVISGRIDRVGVHPTCGTEKLGSRDALLRIAQACAQRVVVADDWGCCAMAGDRGLLHPELTESATMREARELVAADATEYVSDNRACQIALARATGREFRHVVELLEELTR